MSRAYRHQWHGRKKGQERLHPLPHAQEVIHHPDQREHQNCGDYGQKEEHVHLGEEVEEAHHPQREEDSSTEPRDDRQPPHLRDLRLPGLIDIAPDDPRPGAEPYQNRGGEERRDQGNAERNTDHGTLFGLHIESHATHHMSGRQIQWEPAASCPGLRRRTIAHAAPQRETPPATAPAKLTPKSSTEGTRSGTRNWKISSRPP